MIRLQQTVEIDRSVTEVFAFLADFTNVPLWNYFVQSVHQLTPAPVTVGTIYEQVRRTDRQRYRITAHEPPHVIAVATLPCEQPAFDRCMRLEATAGGGTRVHDHWALDTGHPQLLQRLAAGRIRDGVGANLAILKRLLEHDEATLQDGRRVRLRHRSPSRG